MNSPRASHERAYRGLLRLYPSRFRERYSDEMVQLFGDLLRDARAAAGPTGTATTWIRTLADLLVTAASEHARRDQTVAHSLGPAPSPATRALGLAGILGGVLLVAAWVPNLPWSPDLFNFRLVAFNLGAIAIVAAIHHRQSRAAPRLAMAAAIPAVLANAWYLVMIIRAVAQPGEIGRGDYGPLFGAANTAMWLADAWFGLLTFRIGVVSRWPALALAVGSILALNGLGLVTGYLEEIVDSLALAGLTVNGLAWVVLGIEVATRSRVREHGLSAGPGR